MAATVLRSRQSNTLVESIDLCRSRHYVAAAALAKLAVNREMTETALAVRPTLQRFHSGKRLVAFLNSEKVIDKRFRDEITEHALSCYRQMNEPSGKRGDCQQLIIQAASLRRRLRAIQRGL